MKKGRIYLIRKNLTVGVLALLCLFVAVSSVAFPLDEWRKPYTGTGLIWENSNLGIGDIVPEPWIPVELYKGSLKCWGREYKFSDGLLFDQIVSQGEELFSSNPILKIIINGRQISDRGVEWKVTDKGASGITMNAEIAAAKGVIVEMRARLEFDGFIRFDMKFSSRNAFMLNELRLEVPIAEAKAKMYSKFLDYDYSKESVNYESLKDSAGYLSGSFSTPFSPTFWVGNSDVGIEWVSDTNVNWQTQNSNKAINLNKTSAGYSFIANIVNDEKIISEEIIYSFGFYATPVKKSIKDWRKYFFATDLKQIKRLKNKQNHKPFTIIFPWPKRESPLKIHGLPEPYESGANRTKYEKYRQELLDNDVGYIPYTKLYMLSENVEIPQKYWNLWNVGKGKKWPKKGYMGGTRDIKVTLNNKSIQDFYIYKNVQAVKEQNINGVYIDVSTPGTNLVDSIIKNNKQRIQKGEKIYLPLFAHREYMKRLYIATKQIDKDFLIIPHSGKITQLNGAFSDFIISGESINRIFMEMGGIKKIRTIKGAVNYTAPERYVPDYLSLPTELFPEIDYLQNNGFINIILPQINKRNEVVLRKYPEKEIKWSRSLIANALVYDLLIWSKRIHLKTYFNAMNLIDDFITLDDEVEHIPAWQAENFFNIKKTADIALSAYRKNYYAIVVALNRDNNKKDTVITVPEAWLGDTSKVKTAINAETRMQLEPHDRMIRFSIPGKDFVIINLTFE